MTIAIIILAAIVAATVPTAIALGVKYGNAKGDLKIAQDAAERAIKAVEEAGAAADELVSRKDQTIASLKKTIRRLRDDLNKTADPETRSRLAIDSIDGMLQELAAHSDQGPGGDSDSGGVSPQDPPSDPAD